MNTVWALVICMSIVGSEDICDVDSVHKNFRGCQSVADEFNEALEVEPTLLKNDPNVVFSCEQQEEGTFLSWEEYDKK